MAIHVVKEPVPKPGTLGRTELYALAIGQVIGAGVITLIVPAIKMTGYSAWLAYFVAILMGFVMILPFVFISSTLRLGGGNYSMLCDLSSPRTSGVFAYMYLTQCLSLSLFGASAAAYLGDIIPALNSHWARVIVGVTLLTFFYVVNLMGVDIMAKAQKMMTWLLIAALILFAIVGIFKMKLPIFDFSDPNFAINGWGITFNNGQISGGFLGAVLLFVYSTQGYYMTTAYGRDSKNARKDIPFVLLLCVPTLCILYVGVAITETKKICDMAQVYDIGVQIHVCGGPIATAAALQLEATIPNFVIHEEHNANLTSAFVKGGKYYYAPKDGYYTVPELPGIGQEMSEFYIANAKKVVIE